MSPTLAILGGTGAEGFGLALRFAHAGLRVLIGSRDLARAQAAAAKIPHAVGLLNPDAAAQASTIFLTIPASAQIPTLESIRDRLQPGAILVDATVHILPSPSRPCPSRPTDT